MTEINILIVEDEPIIASDIRSAIGFYACSNNSLPTKEAHLINWRQSKSPLRVIGQEISAGSFDH